MKGSPYVLLLVEMHGLLHGMVLCVVPCHPVCHDMLHVIALQVAEPCHATRQMSQVMLNCVLQYGTTTHR